MKLLFVVHERGIRPSGVISVVGELCTGWKEGGQITLLSNTRCQINTPSFDQKWINKSGNVVKSTIFTASDLRINSLPLKIMVRPLWNFFTLLYLVFWMAKEGFDGVLSHSGGWPAGALNRLVIYAAWILRIKQIYLVIHNTPRKFSTVINCLFRIYSSTVEKMCTGTITVSNSCREALISDAGFNAVCIIYNGLPLRQDYSNKLKHPPWNKQHVTIGFVGEIHPRKGLHVLIESLESVDASCELVVIGSGYSPTYEKNIRNTSQSLQHPVHYLGFQDNVQEMYKWIDILVLPSISYESFGLVILEAMRNGIPVICSDFGGMKEVVNNEKTGLVVKSGDPCALSGALQMLLVNKELREQLGREGKIRMELMFDSDKMLTEYCNLFRAN